MNDIIIAVRNALLKMRSDLASKVDDVKVNGTSVVQDGVANIPKMYSGQIGVARTGGNRGLGVTSADYLYLQEASSSAISSRRDIGFSGFGAISPTNLNNAVKAALTDANRITGLTDSEKANACDVIGAVKQKTATKTTYTLTESQNSIEINIPDGVSFINVIGRNSASSGGFTVTYKMTIDGAEKAIIAMANGTSTADGYFNACFENKYGYMFGYGITNYGNATAARKSTEMTASLNGLHPWHVTKLKIQVTNGSAYAGTTFDVFMA